MDKDSNWYDLIIFINKREVDGIISRKDLCECLNYSASVDVYRRVLTLIGFIEEYSRGQYIKRFNIPLDLTSTQAKEIAYSKNDGITKYIRSLKIKNIL